MTVTVRPMGDDEDLAPLTEGNPFAWLVEWVRGLPADPDAPTLWWVGEVDGEAAGFGSAALAPMAVGGFGWGLIHVLGPARRRGLGTAFRAVIEDAVREAGLPGVLYAHDEDDAEAAAAVAAWGLSVSETHHESVLELGALDRGAFAALAARPGLELRPVGDPAALDDGAWHGLHEFLGARTREAPDSADGGGAVPFEMFRSLVREPWSLVTAHDPSAPDDGPLGLTLLMERTGVPTARNTYFTGVVPAARGRGVALALKAQQALLLADAGITHLYTQNMEGNEPILSANRRMGFVRSSGYCDVPVALPPRG